MELQTAQRIGHTTSLRWLKVEGLRVVCVVDEHGKDRHLSTIHDLCNYYTTLSGEPAPVSLFSQFKWQTPVSETLCEEIKTKPDAHRKKPANEPNSKKNSKKDEDIKESTTTMAETNGDRETATKGQVAFEHDVEIVHELLGHCNGELKYLMEFEAWDDLAHRHAKLKEKIPEYSYSFRTKRAIVSYGKLE